MGTLEKLYEVSCNVNWHYFFSVQWLGTPSLSGSSQAILLSWPTLPGDAYVQRPPLHDKPARVRGRRKTS